MLRTHQPDHRRSSDAELLEGLAARDPLALAEAYHRSVAAAYGVARRLLGSPAEIEALLHSVYGELWADPAAVRPLEGWVRRRCFELAAAHLREIGRPPAAPSVATLAADLPAPADERPDRPADPVEEIIASLDADSARVLLEAHDQGASTSEADDPSLAAALLEDALLALGGPDTSGSAVPTRQSCSGLPLGDWVLGLLEPEAARQVEAEVSARDTCATRARLLRRGRRRLEGLPPTPDMGQRVLVSVLAGTPGQAPATTPAPPAGPPASVLDAPLEDDVGERREVEEVDEPGRPDQSGRPGAVAAPHEPAGEPAEVVQAGDERWLWEDDQPEEKRRRGWGRRLLAGVGYLLLVLLGIAAGMAAGSLLVGG